MLKSFLMIVVLARALRYNQRDGPLGPVGIRRSSTCRFCFFTSVWSVRHTAYRRTSALMSDDHQSIDVIKSYRRIYDHLTLLHRLPLARHP